MAGPLAIIAASMSLRRAAAALCALVLMVAACGDDGDADPADEVASLGSTAPGGEAGARVDFQDAVLDVSACLRERGFEVADPTFDDEGNPELSPELAPGVDIGSDEFLDAFDECAAVLEDALPNPLASLDPELEARVRDGLAEFAQCMRDNGVETFPDPRPTGQPFSLRDIISLGADADVDAAQEACQPLLQQLVQEG